MSEQTDENKDADAVLHGDGDGQLVQHGIECSIRPGVPMPATVLACQMGDGALFLYSWRDGPRAYVCAEDAGLLRQALAAAFGTELGNGTTATS
ncbi:MAG: hypothetical protein LC799_32135 [Actinobacteria bacterium]|nr:hypothetical protein [Actinomycetota bacterium]